MFNFSFHHALAHKPNYETHDHSFSMSDSHYRLESWGLQRQNGSTRYEIVTALGINGWDMEMCMAYMARFAELYHTSVEGRMPVTRDEVVHGNDGMNWVN
jgi:hypothetical protein